jgi:hypothetical protein
MPGTGWLHDVFVRAWPSFVLPVGEVGAAENLGCVKLVVADLVGDKYDDDRGPKGIRGHLSAGRGLVSASLGLETWLAQ